MRNLLKLTLALIGLIVGNGVSRAAETLDVSAAMKTLHSVGPKGAGNAEAAAVWQKLSHADAAQLPAILAGLEGANPLAANWIRSAIDAIAERELNANRKLPTAALETFLLDASHDPRGRRLAFEWLIKADPTARERLLAKMLDDSSLEMRRDAVAEKVAAADTLAELPEKKSQAVEVYRVAFKAARDADQIKSLAEKLKKLGQPVDLPVHFGFIMEWKLIGPFDNTDKKGYAIAYPPEKEINLLVASEGKAGPVKWIDYTTSDEFGVVDLNVALTKHMGAVAYAYAEMTVPAARDAEIHLGCITANKVWCNGQLLFENEAYHTAFEIDQYAGKSRLQPGKNRILVKVCQNEQTEAWAQDWKFQLRVCDKLGTAILSTDRPPTPKKVAESNDKEGSR